MEYCAEPDPPSQAEQAKGRLAEFAMWTAGIVSVWYTIKWYADKYVLSETVKDDDKPNMFTKPLWEFISNPASHLNPLQHFQEGQNRFIGYMKGTFLIWILLTITCGLWYGCDRAEFIACGPFALCKICCDGGARGYEKGADCCNSVSNGYSTGRNFICAPCAFFQRLCGQGSLCYALFSGFWK